MKYTRLSSIAILLFLLIFACQTKESSALVSEDLNPPANGFNSMGSDPSAIAIADQVMEAMGGRSNWDQTEALSWVFFGRRQHYWDKNNQRFRIETISEDPEVKQKVFTYDLKSDQIKVTIGGEEVKDSLEQYKEQAKGMWINDSYWLVMPYKLKDSGVTLKHLGGIVDEEGKPCERLEMTFREVGVTPGNRYLIDVDSVTNLVSSWSFFRTVNQDSADFKMPWKDYQPKGDILLSGDRGRLKLTNIQVHESLPDSLFVGL